MSAPHAPTPSPQEGRREPSLEGRTVLVTRPAKQTAGLAEPLQALGATVYSLPAIAIVPPEDFEELDGALWDIDRFDWLVFTSANGVEAVRDRMDALGLKRTAKGRTKIAAVGPATAEAVRQAFYEPDAVPAEYVSDAVADAMGEVRGQWVLLLRADIARKEIVHILRERGALAEDVAAYRIVRPADDFPLPETAPDWIALTSSSAVVGTAETLAARGRAGWMQGARLACIGPLTAATVREMGYEPAVIAPVHTISGLVEAIVAGSTPSPTVPPSAPSSLQREPSPETTYA